MGGPTRKAACTRPRRARGLTSGGRCWPGWRAAHEDGAPYALVVIDPIAAAYACSENDRGLVRQFCTAFDKAAEDSGAAVLLVGHPSKSGDEGYSGNTDWRNAVRGGRLQSAVSAARRLVARSHPGHEYWTPGIRYLCRRTPVHVCPGDVATLFAAPADVEWRVRDQWGVVVRTGPLVQTVVIGLVGGSGFLVEGRLGDVHRLLFDASPHPLPTGVSVTVETGSCVLGGDGEDAAALGAGESATLDPHRLTAASGEWTVTPAGGSAAWRVVAGDMPTFTIQRFDGGGWTDVAGTAEFSGAAVVRLRPHP